MSDELPAGRELDAAVARKMGWQKALLPWNIQYPDSSGSDMWYDADGRIIDPPPVRVHIGVTNLPQFSTEIAHAWIVAEHMRERYPDWLLTSEWTDGGKIWHVDWGFDGKGWERVSAATAPHAICLALVHPWNGV